MFPRALLLPVVLSLVFAAPSDAQCPTPLVRPEPVVAGHGMVDPEDRFGSAVALGGGLDVLSRLPLYAAIGAPRDGGGTVAAYEVGPAGLGVPQTIAHRETRTEDAFGFAVALAQNAGLLAIGAPFHDEPNGRGDAGKVYLYTRGLGGWIEQASLVAPDLAGSDHFGWAVALSQDGGTLVVGAPGRSRSGRETGAVLVFQQAGGAWRFVRELGVGTLSAPGDRLGSSVAIDASGQTIVAGAPGLTSEAQLGRGRAFQFSGDTVSSLGEGGQPAASYGYAVAIGEDGRRIAIGAPGADGEKGSITIVKNGRTESVLGPTCSGGDSSPQLGYSLAMAGDLLIAGARRDQGGTGLAYIYRCSEASCGTAARILPTSDVGSDAEMGRAVALLGDLALIGAPLDAGKAGKAVAYDLGGVVVLKPVISDRNDRPLIVPGDTLKLTSRFVNRSGIGAVFPVELQFPAFLGARDLCRRIGDGAPRCGLPVAEPGHAVDTLAVESLESVEYEIATDRIPPGLRGELEIRLTVKIPEAFLEPTPEGLSQSDRRILEPKATLLVKLTPPLDDPVPGGGAFLFTARIENTGPSSIRAAQIFAEPKRIDRFKWCRGTNCQPTEEKPCCISKKTDLLPYEKIDFRFSGSVSAGAVMPVRLNVSVRPGQGEPGEKSDSLSMNLDPRAKVETSVSSPAKLVPGQKGDRVLYTLKVRHSEGPSLFRGARVEAIPDPLLASKCRLTGGVAQESKLVSRIGNLALGHSVALTLDCDDLSAAAANAQGSIGKPVFRITDVRPANFTHITVPAQAEGDAISMEPFAPISMTLTAPTESIVPGRAAIYDLEVRNTGLSESPKTLGGLKFLCAGSDACTTARTLHCSPVGSNEVVCAKFPWDLPPGTGCACTITAGVDPSARGGIELRAWARSGWPWDASDQYAKKAEASSGTIELEPQAGLKAWVIAPDEPLGSALAYEVKVSNLGGPSDAQGTSIELFVPALLTGVKWCPFSAGSTECPEDAETLDGSTARSIGMLPVGEVRRYLVTGTVTGGDEAHPRPGPLVLAAKATSPDAFPRGPRIPAAVTKLPGEIPGIAYGTSAALVVRGSFKPGGKVHYFAFLENATENEAGDLGGEPEFTIDFPAKLGLLESCDGDTFDPTKKFSWDGVLPPGDVMTIEICAKILVEETTVGEPYSVEGKTRFDKDPAGMRVETPSHCPYSEDAPSETTFYLDGATLPDGASCCGAFSTALLDDPQLSACRRND